MTSSRSKMAFLSKTVWPQWFCSVGSAAETYLLATLLAAVIMPAPVAESCYCKPEIDSLSRAGVRIEALSGSRVELRYLKKEFHRGSHMSVYFRTKSSNGVIFYATGHNHDRTFVAVELYHGYLRYVFRCRMGSAHLVNYTRQYNDNLWHRLMFRREAGSAMIYVDGKAAFRDYFVICDGFTSFTFGGVRPGDWRLSVFRPVFGSQFDGCLERIRLSTGLRAAPNYHAVSSCDV